MDPDHGGDCETAWQQATADLCSPELSTRWLHRIRTHYNEPQRHYHTLEHVRQMLQLAKKHATLLTNVNAVILAIFFHDVIYDPKAKDNEEKSAQLFQEFACTDGVKIPVKDSSSVSSGIHATKNHLYHTCENNQVSDMHYLLDMDLAVLGAPRQEYSQYARAIRLEYCHVPEPQFREGRSKILTTFLAARRLYYTDTFRELYEDAARNNLIWEIEQLTTVDK